jgi:type I restriction enzyme R subunit
MPPPEQVARQKIDTMLLDAGWTIQNFRELDLAAKSVALREVPLKFGRCDYLLLTNRQPVGVVEAKKMGTRLSKVAEQSRHYGENLPDFLATHDILPFYYESTGAETFFRDERDPHPRSRSVFAFHRPETLAQLLAKSETIRYRLAQLRFAHPLVIDKMRDCQVEAIKNLERSFARGDARALIQMATGAGKTFTACAFTYRLIKHAGAKRVLFLVDRANLGRQAKGEFDQFVTPDGRKFTELYNVQYLTSNKLDDVCRVTICTIQRLYSMLRGEDALANHLSFELRNRAENVQLQARRRVRRGCVDPLARHYQRDVARRKLTYDLGEVREASAKPIQLETHNDIDLPSAHRYHEAIEPLPR